MCVCVDAWVAGCDSKFVSLVSLVACVVGTKG